MTKIFLDANILIDISDDTRPYAAESGKLFAYLVQNRSLYELFTSCDLMTTVYYLLRKQLDKKTVLKKLKIMNSIMTIVDFSNKEIDEALYLMEKNNKFSDLEDTIQFVMAKKVRCDYMVTHDKGFYSYDIPILGSKEALETLSNQKQ